MALVEEVVVETNWILDVALDQDDASVDLFEYAKRGEIRLFLPSFAVAESIKNVEAKGNQLWEVLRPIEVHRTLFRLSDGCAERVNEADVAIAVLRGQIETRFWRSLEEVAAFARLVEPTLETVRRTRSIRDLLKLSPADSTVLATVCELARVGGCGNFMSRDKRAFDRRDTKDYMRKNGITYYESANPIVGPRRAVPPTA